MTFKPVLTGFAGRKAICDAETYPNFILIKFEDVDTGEVHRFVIDADPQRVPRSIRLLQEPVRRRHLQRPRI